MNATRAALETEYHRQNPLNVYILTEKAIQFAIDNGKYWCQAPKKYYNLSPIEQNWYKEEWEKRKYEVFFMNPKIMIICWGEKPKLLDF